MAEELTERAVAAAVAVARGYGVEVRERRVLSDTDFEDSCAGPVEWDLACLALSAGADADEALDTYGRQHDDALEPFLDARRLQGALWTALVAERHPGFRARAEDRLSRRAGAT